MILKARCQLGVLPFGFPRGKRAADVTFLMNRKILKARDLAELTGYHVKHICRLARQEKIDGNRANPGGKQIWWIDDERIRRWIDSRNSANLDDNSKRKFLWDYVPTKERKALEGDSNDAPTWHPLTFINYLLKWHRQVKTGQIQAPPLEVLRHDFEQPVFLMIELMGTEYFLERLAEFYRNNGDEIFEKLRRTD
jgi:hypothetical protein